MLSTEKIRNIAIIAHVDHGKTTLVDQLLRQSQTLGEREELAERAMDSNDLEKERGITILAKNTAITWNDYHINIIDTPGHADFGGEVERVLSMVDCVLLLVDAVDGPMPQTRFVTQKAFALGLKPIVVINKMDRDGARADWVLDQTFDLFDSLGATDEQLDFPVIYASAMQGICGLESDDLKDSMTPLYQTIVDKVPAPDVDLDGPFQLQVSALDYNSYVGLIGIGRVKQGKISNASPIKIIDRDGKIRSAKIGQLFGFHGLNKIEIDEAKAGDIISFTGMDELFISDTLCDPETVEMLPPLVVDEPTVQMAFQVNNSPFAGKDGKFVTSRRIRDRLMEETKHNVALRVEDTDNPDKFLVSGRGELHLGILLENMRREGYELAVSRPEVVMREVDGEMQEPYEKVTADVPEEHQGAVMQTFGERKGQLENMMPDGKGRVRLDYLIPARGLIGFQTDFMSMTSGTGLLYHVFDHYGAYQAETIGQRNNGALISNSTGKALAFALFNLQNRGKLFISHAEEVYEGMVIGIHAKSNDLTVNPLKAKQLTNIRAAGTDENLILTTPVNMTLESALAFIDDDELVEITPNFTRIRKRFLLEHERKRASRSGS